MSSNRVIVISAPSGTGKTTLNRRLVSEMVTLDLSVSHTTRAIRPGEMNGDHYWFITMEQFQAQIADNKMLEWANVFGNMYGTSRDELERIAAAGHDVLLEIDVQGWQQAKEHLSNALAIFILPPTIRELWDRLANRGTDNLATRLKRLRTARAELDHASSYGAFIINDHLDRAYKELKDLVGNGTAGSLDFNSGLDHCQTLIREFDQADWLREIESQCIDDAES